VVSSGQHKNYIVKVYRVFIYEVVFDGRLVGFMVFNATLNNENESEFYCRKYEGHLLGNQ
jgi:hypothetical protein